jgi:hypothetical protein
MKIKVLRVSGFVVGFSFFYNQFTHRLFLKTSQYLLAATVILFYGCASNNEPQPIDCDESDLSIEVSGQNPSGCSANDGSITATASGGNAPYKFAINTGTFGTSSVFNNLGGGNYIVLVTDKNECVKSVEILLELPGIDPLTAEAVIVSDTECLDNVGSIDLHAAGGTPPYQYKLGTGAFGDVAQFNNLAPGNYSVAVKDGGNCIFVKGVTVGRGDSQTSLVNDVKPIIETKCAITGCHSGSQAPNFTLSTNIISNAGRIKTLTQSGQMPPSNSSAGGLTAAQKALIECWVDDGAKDN